MWLEPGVITKIFNTKVRECETAGIQIIGDSESPLIEFCEIENNKGPGISITTGNRGQIRKNKIKGNEHGVEIIISDPTLFKNQIVQNEGEGIATRSVNGFVCAPKITDNNISSNKFNGILCQGIYPYIKYYRTQ